MRPHIMAMHVTTVDHRLSATVAALHADGWIRAAPHSALIQLSEVPWKRAPSSVQLPHGRETGTDKDFGYACWTRSWAFRIAALTIVSPALRRHWIALRARDPAPWEALDASTDTLMLLGGPAAVADRYVRLFPPPGWGPKHQASWDRANSADRPVHIQRVYRDRIHAGLTFVGVKV